MVEGERRVGGVARVLPPRVLVEVADVEDAVAPRHWHLGRRRRARRDVSVVLVRIVRGQVAGVPVVEGTHAGPAVLGPTQLHTVAQSLLAAVQHKTEIKRQGQIA